MISFASAIASGPMQPFSISISGSELIQSAVTFVTVGCTRQMMVVNEETLMIEQKFSYYVPVVALKSGIMVMPRGIELASVAVVLLASVGFILAMVAPGTFTGIILPLALVAWWLLYREIKKRGL